VYVARLTDAGKAAFEEMALIHRGWVGELLDGLTDTEQQQLYDLLTKLRETLYE
jgi:DNA-binding MarR family transcriptional regulator